MVVEQVGVGAEGDPDRDEPNGVGGNGGVGLANSISWNLCILFRRWWRWSKEQKHF